MAAELIKVARRYLFLTSLRVGNYGFTSLLKPDVQKPGTRLLHQRIFTKAINSSVVSIVAFVCLLAALSKTPTVNCKLSPVAIPVSDFADTRIVYEPCKLKYCCWGFCSRSCRVSKGKASKGMQTTTTLLVQLMKTSMASNQGVDIRI